MSSDDDNPYDPPEHPSPRASQAQGILTGCGLAGVLFLLGIVVLFGIFVGTCLR